MSEFPSNGLMGATSKKEWALYMHHFQSLNVNGTRRHQKTSERPSGPGGGYRPSKQLVKREAARKSASEKLDAIRQHGELDPSCSSAARSLNAFSMSAETDFDEGVRSLQRWLRDATIADSVFD